MDAKLNLPAGSNRKLISFVTDRPGHDKRYAIDASKIKNEIGWTPTVNPDQGLILTIDWYLENENWLNNVTSGTYQDYYLKHYK